VIEYYLERYAKIRIEEEGATAGKPEQKPNHMSLNSSDVKNVKILFWKVTKCMPLSFFMIVYFLMLEGELVELYGQVGEYAGELQAYQMHFGVLPCRYPQESEWNLDQVKSDEATKREDCTHLEVLSIHDDSTYLELILNSSEVLSIHDDSIREPEPNPNPNCRSSRLITHLRGTSMMH